MNANGKIPLVDLITLHRELEGELVSIFRAALKTARFVGRLAVETFEREFAQLCGTGHCVGVLAEGGIATGIHYPIPLHLQKAYRNLGFQKGDFPVSELTAEEVLSLPLYPRLRGDQQRQVLNRIHEFPLSVPAVPASTLA